MLTFISINPWVQGLAICLFFLLVIIIVQTVTEQVEKYFKVKYNKPKAPNEPMPKIRNLEIKEDEKIKLPDTNYDC